MEPNVVIYEEGHSGALNCYISGRPKWSLKLLYIRKAIVEPKVVIYHEGHSGA